MIEGSINPSAFNQLGIDEGDEQSERTAICKAFSEIR